MSVKLFILEDIENFIKANNWQEVSTAQFFLNGIPHDKGLFSPSIFGETIEDQQNMFGYIDLIDNFIHPMVRITLKNLGSLNNLLLQLEHPKKKWAVVKEGRITFVSKDTPGAKTGTEFFYDNFDKINWMKTSAGKETNSDATSEMYEGEEIGDEADNISLTRKNRLLFLSTLTKKEFFVNKWLVLPLFYRDQSTEKSSVGSSINNEYKKLIQSVRSLKTFARDNSLMTKTRDMFHNLIESNILINLYNETMSIITGKHVDWKKTSSLGNKTVGVTKTSDFHTYLIGKSLDFATSSVITAPNICKFETGDDYNTPFGYTLTPMAQLLSAFFPFIEKEVTDIISIIEDRMHEILKRSEEDYKGRYPSYTPKEIRSVLRRFIKSEGERTFPVIIKYLSQNNTKEGTVVQVFEYKTQNDVANGKYNKVRLLSWTDIIFLALTIVTKKRHALVLRYPLTNYQNIYVSRINIASTRDTSDKFISCINTSLDNIDYDLILEKDNNQANDLFNHVIEFKDYPDIPDNTKFVNKQDFIKQGRQIKWQDVLVIGNSVLPALGADYDGDMIFLRGLFSNEANEEAAKLLFSPVNVFGPDGKGTRGIASDGREPVLGAYLLTRD